MFESLKRQLQGIGWPKITIATLLIFLGLALLSAILTPRIGSFPQPKMEVALTDINNLNTALNGFQLDTGRYPSTTEGLKALFEKPAGALRWAGPYMKSVWPDPWGHPYIYHFPGITNPEKFDLLSAGADGKEGTADDVILTQDRS